MRPYTVDVAHEETGSVDALPVYLVHWRQPNWCERAVATIEASTVATRIEVINNSPELQDELERRLAGRATVVDTRANLGYTGGANTALGRWLTGPEPFAVVAAHDLHVEPDCFEQLLATAAAEPGFGVLGPVLTRKGGGANSVQQVIDDDGVDTDWLSGTCLFIRRSCAEEIGGFDEALRSYGEDVDYCRRARAAGWRIGLVPTAHANGLGSGDATEARKRSINDVRLQLMYHGWRPALRRWVALWRVVVVAAAIAVTPWKDTTTRAEARLRARDFLRVLRLTPRVFAHPQREIRFPRSS